MSPVAGPRILLSRSVAVMSAAVSVALLLSGAPAAVRAQAMPAEKTTTTTSTESNGKPMPPMAADAVTEGAVTVNGVRIPYRAIAGTITVGATDAQDAMLRPDGQQTSDSAVELPTKPQDRPATARMFYTAYLRTDAGDTGNRPVTFIYNGGPGSATMYLHMAAFGPRRIVLQDLEHPDGGPYRLVNNDSSLLDASDLIFIDAPGAGYSRVQGKDAMKDFYGVDQDANAFNRFIRKWLSKNNRWTSPRFIFGESYGTTRSAVLSDLLSDGVDLNGVILLSQILNFNNTADGPEGNPGTEQAYFLSLPSFAATAWFHRENPHPHPHRHLSCMRWRPSLLAITLPPCCREPTSRQTAKLPSRRSLKATPASPPQSGPRQTSA